MSFVFDIDGTIADNSHRMHLIDKKGKGTDWDEYHATLEHDLPLISMIAVLAALKNAGYTIYLITGRPERYRDLTEAWLAKHRIDHDGLFMRPDGDYCKNAELKARVMKQVIESSGEIMMMFDDHPGVIEKCKEMKIPCAHIPNPDYDGI